MRKFFKRPLNNDIHALLQNILSLLSLRGLNFIVPIITLPYLLKILSPHFFGVITFAEAVVFYFVSFTEYSFNVTGTRKVSKNRDNSSLINKTYSRIFYSKLFIALFGFLLLNVYFIAVDSSINSYLIFITTYFSVFGYFLLPTWYFQGIEKMKFIALLNLSAKIIFAILIFLAVKSEQDYLLVPLFNSSGFLIAGLCGHFIATKYFKVKITFPGIKAIGEQLKEDFNVFTSIVTPTLYNNTSIFILGLVASPAIVGYFSAANKFVEIALSMIRILSNALFPYLNRNFHHHPKASKLLLSMGFLLSLFLYFGAETLLTNLGSNLYSESILPLKFLAPCPFILAIIQSYGTNYLLILEKDKLVRNITLISSLLGLSLAIITIPLLEITGVIITLLTTRALLGSFNLISFIKINKERKCSLEY